MVDFDAYNDAVKIVTAAVAAANASSYPVIASGTQYIGEFIQAVYDKLAAIRKGK